MPTVTREQMWEETLRAVERALDTHDVNEIHRARNLLAAARQTETLPPEPTVVVYIEGGNYRGASSNLPDLDVIVWDNDKITAGAPEPDVPSGLQMVD